MLHHFLGNIPSGPVLDEAISRDDYTLLDLSTTNRELDGMELGDPEVCQGYIDSVLSRNSARVAFGGYLECRNLYRGHSGFNPAEEPRDVHLGVDFWTKAGTRVLAPLDGEVHSFRNNAIPGDYGPTIILAHRIGQSTFYSLYGHLSLESLDGLRVGKSVRKGEAIGSLGTPEINVNYAPHLHFQLICDLQGQKGDYPGVCKASEVPFYQKNCPDPLKFLAGFRK